MPYKPARPCRYPGCLNTTNTKQGYCEAHTHHNIPFVKRSHRQPDNRPSASARGYGVEWKSIRQEVLDSVGIPRESQGLYDVHHTPPYNPAIEPDHRAYKLIPMLKSEHSKITSRGGRIKSLGEKPETIKASRKIHTTKKNIFQGESSNYE